MVDRSAAGKLKILPIMLHQGDRLLLKWLSQQQYLKFSGLRDPAGIVPVVERSLDDAAVP